MSTSAAGGCGTYTRWRISVMAVLVLVSTGMEVTPASADPVADPVAVRTEDRSPLPRERTAPVGAVDGSHSVTDHGQAAYTVPIEVPPGVAGMRPVIALVHDPGRRDGLLGRGWTISGQSVIESCPLNHAQGRGTPQPISAGPEHPGVTGYCLDGQLLVQVPPTPGTGAGVEYRTEEESFVKVVARDVGEKGPTGFDVWTKDGRLRRYGFTGDSVDGFPHRRWRLSRESDRSGNLIDMVYGADCRGPQNCTVPALAEIRYGGRADQPHDRLVRFGYDTLPYERVTYSRGERRPEWRRLARVETLVDGAVVRRYRLDYRTTNDTSTLTAVRECVDDPGGEVCKPPTTLEHVVATGYPGTEQPGEAESFVTAAFGNAPLSSRRGHTIVLDANGDGRDDLVYPTTEKQYRLSLATGDRARPWKHVDTRIRTTDVCLSQDKVADLDGDGRDDIVACGHQPDGVTVFLSTGEGFRPDKTMLSEVTNDGKVFWLADLDGDLRVDVLNCDEGIWLNAGGRFVRRKRTAYLDMPPQSASPGPKGTSAYGGNCGAPLLMDVDGDGVVNVVKSDWRHLRDFKVRNVVMGSYWRRTFEAFQLTTGSTGFAWIDTGLSLDWYYGSTEEDVREEPTKTTSAPSGEIPLADPPPRQIRQLDDNGDGLTDLLVYQQDHNSVDIRLYTNTGRGFVQGPNLRTHTGWWDWTRLDTAAEFAAAQFYDVDGDGRDDALLPTGENSGWVLHRAGGEPEQAGAWSVGALPLVLADVDGDGSRDVVTTAATTYKEYDGTPLYRMNVRYGNQARSGLLEQVADGVGRRVTFTYAGGAPVYRRMPWCENTQSWCLSRTGPLVSQVAVHAAGRPSSGTGVPWSPVATYRYTYRDARMAWYGRGYLGMGQRTQTAVDPDGRTLSTVVREFGNGMYIASSEGEVQHRYPGAGRLVVETTTSAPVASDQGPQRMVTRTAITTVERKSSDGRPFTYDQEVWSNSGATDASGEHGTHLGSRTVRSVLDEDGNTEFTSTTWRNRYDKEVASRSVNTRYDNSELRLQQRMLGLVTSRTETEERGGRSAKRTVTFTYTADRGLLELATTDPDDEWNSLLTSTTYDRFGNPEEVAQSAPARPELGTRTTTTQWDDRGLLPVSTTDAEGHTSTIVQDRASGASLVQIDPNGVVVRNAYDGFGRPVRRRTAVGDTVTAYARADEDASADREARVRTTQTVEGGRTTLTEVDAVGRTVRTGRSGYQGAMLFTDTRYDPQGKPESISRPHRGAGPDALSRYEHDALGRLVKEAQPDEESADDRQTTTRFDYTALGTFDKVDGADPAVQDVAATQVEVRSDTSGTVNVATQVEDHAGDVVARRDATGALTQIVRGPFGVIDRIIDADGKVTRFETDKQGRTTAVDSPDAGRHIYTWTPFGDLRVQIDAAKQVTEYEYDLLGRVTSREDTDGVATWQYDGPGANAVGKLTGSRSVGHRMSLTYEPVPADGPNRGLLASSTDTVDGGTLVTRLRYDGYGRPDRTEYPSSGGRPFVVDQRYDAVGNVVDVRQAGSGTPYWEFTGSGDGIRISDERLGGEFAVHSTHGALSGRRTRVTARRGDTVVHDLEAGYDDVGKVQGVTDRVEPKRDDLTGYDTETSSQRVTAWDASDELVKQPEEYTYRPGGQIQNKKGVGDYRYDSRPRAVVAVGRNSYAYDANGRQTERTGPDIPGGRQQITYTVDGLTSSVETGRPLINPEGPETPQITQYRYDAEGQRVLRKSPSSVTAYASDLYEHHRNLRTGAVENRYNVRVNGRVVARVVRPENVSVSVPAVPAVGPDAVSYLIADHVGSPRTVLAADGGARQGQQWTAFGRPVEPDQQPVGEIGFAGLREDPGLGLVETGGRMYDPMIGRFLSPDPVLVDVTGGRSPAQAFASRVTAGKRPAGGPPLQAADLLDPYAYAGNNPAAYVDPTGRAAESAGQSPPTPLRFWSAATAGFVIGAIGGWAPFGWAADPFFAKLNLGRTFERNRALAGLAASTAKTDAGLAGMAATTAMAPAAVAAAPATGGASAVADVAAFGAAAFGFQDGSTGSQVFWARLQAADTLDDHVLGQAFDLYGIADSLFKVLFGGDGLPAPQDLFGQEFTRDAAARSQQFVGDLAGVSHDAATGSPELGSLVTPGSGANSSSDPPAASFDDVSMGDDFMSPFGGSSVSHGFGYNYMPEEWFESSIW